MKLARALLLSGLPAGLIAAGGVAGQSDPMPGVSNPAQARVDYKLKCQGCHRTDGSGDDFSNPPMRDMVARFLTVPGGREFLGRVPGVSTADLDDARLANLLNWTLYTFDPQHVPQGFRPFTAAELGALRRNPLRLERAAVRARLVAGFSQAGNNQNIQN